MDLPLAHIEPNLASAGRDSVLRELLALLVQSGAVPESKADALFTLFLDRENTLSSGIGFGVAVPQIFTDLSSEPIFAVGRSVGGFDFNSLDRQPVHLIVMAILPTTDKPQHLRSLARIAKAFNARESRVAFSACDSAARIKALWDRLFGQ